MIGFIGLSHLGIVSSIAAAAKGLEVVGYDPDAARCQALNQGRFPLFEPGLAELLGAHQEQVRFTDDPSVLRGCEVLFLSLDVVTDEHNCADLAPLERLVEATQDHLPRCGVLVILCQVPPGFTRKLKSRLTAGGRHGELQIYYQVETLIFGRAVERALHPERFIVGCPEPDRQLPAAYGQVLAAYSCPVLPMRYESAELAKIAINMCLVASVNVANTMAELSEAIGADWAEVVPALKLDQRIGPQAYLVPGLGIAGGNLERDLVTVRRLAAEHGTDAGIVDAWLSNSRYRRDWTLRTLHTQLFARNNNPTIAIWGLAYKAGTASTRNSPALVLLEALQQFSVQVYDPQATVPAGPNLIQAASPLEACRGADVLVIMTAWEEFSTIDPAEILAATKGPLIVDPFGVLDGRRFLSLGSPYFRLGVTPEHED